MVRNALDDALDTLRRPEYTGENRCTPCTVLNTALALCLALLAGAVAPAAGVLVLAASLAAITLRGYLVPGTPTLTKRALPDRVLRRFETGHAVGADGTTRVAGDDTSDGDADAGADGALDPEFDPEATLRDAGVLVERETGSDLTLAPDFRAAWRERIAALRDERTVRVAFADVVGIDASRVTVRDAGGSFVANVTGGGRGGVTWPSEAAYRADVAAGRVLDERDPETWDALGPDERVVALSALRLFAEHCPACDGPVSFGEDVVESCCRAVDVVAVTCDDCGTRVFELEQPDEPASAA
ncbi:hypothetical protein J2752_002351 [Halarchaeum rubridurum]|uniref:Uncharacterized protein n=1 Tax=Halarchaeum rubridurum TaxID=489911 RepID=A0A830G2E1_9EURY|nr:hypothetical protein [Halarchaeum rubridurum]MBP1955428.1 hypothetical protein [Halarchaeum rubridurum]GGM72308.1 hypothetical protein GCM10009017_22810 [Halarchaeum rubridurum]